MTKYVVTSGDYHIKTNDAGSIFLDTGNQIGQVYMTGNLVVKGTTTQVDATKNKVVHLARLPNIKQQIVLKPMVFTTRAYVGSKAQKIYNDERMN